MLAGRLLPRNAASGLNPIAFVAGAADVQFTGPAAGSVVGASLVLRSANGLSALELACGGFFSCAVSTSGATFCMGANNAGQVSRVEVE